MKFSRTFFRIMGICAFVAAALDVVSWILSRFITYPTNFSEHLTILSNPNYPAQIYVIIISLLFALPVYWGITAKKLDTHASTVLIAFIFKRIGDTFHHINSSYLTISCLYLSPFNLERIKVAPICVPPPSGDSLAKKSTSFCPIK